MTSASDARNPTGLVLTPEQREQSLRERYWIHAIEYGLNYYVTGRFATAHHFTPVAANILHHAVEMLLKACLAKRAGPDAVRKHGHKLASLWNDFKKNYGGSAVPAEFDRTVRELDAFEDIRYPETMIRDGALISLGIFEVDTPVLEDGRIPEIHYQLMLPQIDRLVGFLFEATGGNPDVFLPRIVNDAQAIKYYDMVRSSLLGRST